MTHGDTVLYQKDFATGAADWKLGAGDWKVQDGALRQTSEATDLRATVGDPAWTDYTYSLKARKIAGAEGFLILFHAQDPDNYIWWNIGGWGNTRHQLQRTTEGTAEDFGNGVHGKIEKGRWYDIKIELYAGHVKAYLDGKLVNEANYKRS